MIRRSVIMSKNRTYKTIALFLSLVFVISLIPVSTVHAISPNPYDYCNVIWEKYGYLEATQTVNVREMPTSKSAKLGTLKARDVIQVTGQTDTDWFRITYQGKVAYVYGYYFTRTAGTNTRAQYMEDAYTGMPGAVLMDYHTSSGVRQFNAYLVQTTPRGVALYGPTADSEATADNWGSSTYSPAFVRIIDNSAITNQMDDLTKFVAVTESYINYLKEYYIDTKTAINSEQATIYYNCLMNSLGLNAYQVYVSPEYCQNSNEPHIYSHVVVSGIDFYCDPLWIAQGRRRDLYLYATYANIVLNDSHYSCDIWGGGLDYLYAHQYSYQMLQDKPKVQ